MNKARKPEPNKFYTLAEAVGFTSISRGTFSQYVSLGLIQVLKNDSKKKSKTGNRYLIKGDWIEEFNESVENGEIRTKLFSIRSK